MNGREKKFQPRKKKNQNIRYKIDFVCSAADHSVFR